MILASHLEMKLMFSNKLITGCLILSVTLCIIFSVGAWREFEFEQLLNRPGIISSETSKNLGVIPVGESGKAVFDLQNACDFPINIVDISRNCGCTKTVLSKKALAIGEVVNLIVAKRSKVTSASYTWNVCI